MSIAASPMCEKCWNKEDRCGEASTSQQTAPQGFSDCCNQTDSQEILCSPCSLEAQEEEEDDSSLQGQEEEDDSSLQGQEEEEEDDCSLEGQEEEDDDSTSASHHNSHWAKIPCTILEKIYYSMSYCERLKASSVCKKWRNCLYIPRLWWNISLYVTTKREGKKAFFLTKCIHFAKTVYIHWPAVYSQGNPRSIRPLDLHNKETLKTLFTAMRECCNLRQLILKLENPCAYSLDFSRPVQEDVAVVCHKNPRLCDLSFGCNSTITPPCILNLLPKTSLQHLEELHIARFKPSFCRNPHDCVPVLSSDDLKMFSQMKCLRELSLDWSSVSPGLICGLTQQSVLKKLNFIVASHLCSESSHPSEEDWREFGERHSDVHITLTFIQHFRGVCRSLKYIKPGVYLVKIAECSFIDPEVFGDLLSWHGGKLCGLVHVAKWKNIELEVGAALWPYVVQCRNLKHLTFLGHFLLDEVVLFIASHFRLESLVVSKPHVMTFAEASPYLIPSTATKYNQFKQEVGALLERPWEALPDVPFEGLYFAEGKDDAVYVAGH